MKANPAENATLFARGRGQAAMIAERVGNGDRPHAALRRVAADLGRDFRDVRRAVRFAAAVDRIALSAGAWAKRLILAGDRRLTRNVVILIGRTPPDRQRGAMARAAAGLCPFAGPHAGDAPPFEALGHADYSMRIARSAGVLDGVAAGLEQLPAGDRPAGARLRALGDRAAEARESCAGLRAALGGEATPAPVKGRDPARPPWAPEPFDPVKHLALVDGVWGMLAKAARDVPRLTAEAPPAGMARTRLLTGLGCLGSAALRLDGVVGSLLTTTPSAAPRVRRGGRGRAAGGPGRGGPTPSVVEAPGGPADDSGGTYVVLSHVPAAADVTVKSGRAFALPAGHYTYVGSAIMPGGVRGRVGHHLAPGTDVIWNVDSTKSVATPLEVWYAFGPEHLEHAWAAALAASPASHCPAPGFGAMDCRICPTHYFHFAARPCVHDFARRVGGLVPNHPKLYRWSLRSST